MKRRKVLGLLAAAPAIAQPARAQSGDWNQVVDAARKEGKLVIYTASIGSYLTFYLIDGFKLSAPEATTHLVIFSAAVAAGTLLGGPLTDRIGRKTTMWLSILGVLPFNLGVVNTLVADPLKLFTKEDFVPAGADRPGRWPTGSAGASAG